MSTSSGDRLQRPAGAFVAILVALFAAPAAADTVEYYATVDRERMALDETLTLQVTLAFDQDVQAGEPVLPETPDFDVVRQGRSDQMSFSFGGGGSAFRKIRTWTLVLQPRREGKLVILPGRVEVGGKRYETGRITVEVAPARGGGQRQAQPAPQRPPGFPPIPGFDDDPFDALLGGGPQPSENDLFLRATVDRREVHVGEQVTLSVWLFSRVDVRHVEGLKMPRLDGFWAEELQTPRQISAETRVIDGVPYQAYLIQRRALFPLRAGEMSIEPVELDVVTGRSLFGGGRRQHRKSLGATLTVRPLPEGAPPAFRRGNVGQWSLRVEATPQEVALGDPVTVRVVAEGQGNLRNLELPELGKIDGFKLFEPTRSEEVAIRDLRYGGSKTAEYVLVPERAGSFEVPPLAFAFFDPKAGQYVSMETAPIALTVLQGQGSAVAQAPAPPAPQERQRDGGLVPPRVAPVIVAAQEPLWSRPWFLAALLAPALAVLGVVAAPLLRRGGTRPARRKAKGRAAPGLPAEVRRLAEAGDAAFWAACEKALLDGAAARLGRPAHGLQRSELLAALRAAGVEEGAVEAARETLVRCEMARYAPGALDAGAVAAVRDAAERALAGMEAA